MSGRTRKPPIKSKEKSVLLMHRNGSRYHIPLSIAQKYRIGDDHVTPEQLFSSVNLKYTKPGALLKGFRLRDDLTQLELAKKIKVTQSDISQMENGRRKIGREIAKRIARLFNTDYRQFLE